jgi:hypothetical protein
MQKLLADSTYGRDLDRYRPVGGRYLRAFVRWTALLIRDQKCATHMSAE